MPLFDHFRPPLSELRPWESFHTTWASSIADYLNREILPAGYIALEQVHAGASMEIDVANYLEAGADPGVNGGTATLTRRVWTPAKTPLLLPAVFPPNCTVEILTSDGGRTLVAAVELVSPGNKDRNSKRRLFAAKCATYLSRGIGLIIIDVVTTRQGNLHNELIDLLGLEPAHRMSTDSVYCVAYRPLHERDGDRIDTWPENLAVGETLPTMPLSLAADFCVPLELELPYQDACQRRRLDEVRSA